MANISYGVNLLPKTNNAYTLGNSDYKWSNIYTVQINGTNVSDLGSVQDVQINGNSILNNGVANIPEAGSETYGVLKTGYSTTGLQKDGSGYLKIYPATSDNIKAGTEVYRPIVPYHQHESIFYGLAKVAGDTTQANSLNTVGNYTNEAKAAIKEMLGTDEWFERNDLDADITGKVNMLLTPYSMDDILQGKIIYANGSINNTSSQCVSPLIPISAGTYGLKTSHNEYIGDINSGNSYKNGYGFFAADGTTIVTRPENLLHSLGNDIYVFEVPDEAVYIRFCYGASGPSYYEDALEYFNQWILLPDADDNIDSSFFVVQQKKSNIEVDKLLRLDGSYALLRDSQARRDVAEALGRPITFGRKTCAIFEKVCCIGDSFTAGYIYHTSGDAYSDQNYSWVRYIQNATGKDYVNCGVSGATTKSWLTSENGLAKAQLPENKAQAYIIALQINDAATDLSVGTVSDIGTAAETYYGCTSKIIDEVFTINDKAHIFLLTQPKNFVGEHTPYRTAILNIVEWYQANGTHQNQVHLIDLLDYWQLFHNPGCYDSSAGGHYTAVGWEYTAEIIMFAWSEYINAHPLLFQDVNLIPYGINLTGKVTDVQINSTSIVNNGVANIPYASLDTFGVTKIASGYGLFVDTTYNTLKVSGADISTIKAGTHYYRPIVPVHQHEAVFYGLAKAAGDTTQSASSNSVGVYTDNAKSAIQNMLAVAPTNNARFTGTFSINNSTTIPLGVNSISIGGGSMASGNGAIALGITTEARAGASIAIGLSAKTKGTYSTAIGEHTQAQYQAGVVMGTYNALDDITDWAENTIYTENDLVYVDGFVYKCTTAHTSTSTFDSSKWSMVLNKLFVIGNGDNDSSRSNAMTIDISGNTRIQGNLYIGANADGSGGTILAPIEVIRL